MSGSTTLLAGHVLALLTLVGTAFSFVNEPTLTKFGHPAPSSGNNRLLSTANQQAGRRLSEASSTSTFGPTAQIVDRCKIYSNEGKCLYCIRDSFLNATSGVCQDISYSKLIQHCNIYSSQTTCYQCDSNYYLNATGACATNTLENCAVQADAATCKTCVKGAFLANGKCSAAIANCDVASSASICATCSMGYYWANSACSTVPSGSVIANCQAYTYTGGVYKCASCAKGFAMEVDGSVCWNKSQVNNQIDLNCEETVVNTGQYCHICRQGYYLSNNACTKIPDDNIEGCFIANWSNPSLCLVCMPGFQISTTNKCSFVGVENKNNTDPLASSTINNALVAIAVGLLLLTN